MANVGTKPFIAIGPLSPEMRIAHFYRIFSFILTSAFYCICTGYTFYNKISLVLFLALAAIILDYIYLKYASNIKLIKIMTIVETISNIIILLPSGGINSPYIWYSLNTVLVSSYFLSTVYVSINLLAYSTLLTVVSFLLAPKSGILFMTFLMNNSNLVLSYILIIIAMNVLIRLIKLLNVERKNLEKINGKLVEANNMVSESLDNIASLYKNIGLFINIKNRTRLIELITKYTKEITKSPAAFLYTGVDLNRPGLETAGFVDDQTSIILLAAFRRLWNRMSVSEMVIKEVIADRIFIISAVRSFNNFYGMLGVEIKSDCGEIIEEENIKQLKFLASLSSVLFERFKAEEMNENLLITEEQNRIANEIHDSVSQRLFYTSCKISNMTRKANRYNLPYLNDEFSVVKESLDTAIKELRETIYSYSRKKYGMTAFEESIRKYVSDISRLNDVNIELNIKGSFELINYEIKKGILRILLEGCGNAIRHGMSKNVRLELFNETDRICIKICDDGIGFDSNDKVQYRNMGMGIKNMHSLVYSFNGDISIESKLNKGTTVSVTIPVLHQKYVKAVEVV